MPSFSIRIDEDKCAECGLCAKDCVNCCIMMENDKPAVKNPQWCNRCSHCVAVCPVEAVVHEGLQGQAWRPVRREKLDPESCREIVMTRRSVRWYKPEPVAREEIEDILNLAAYSPTASNTMDVAYSVITDRELIQKTGRKVFATAEKIEAALHKPWGKAIYRVIRLWAPQLNLDRYLDRFEIYKSWVREGRDMILHNAPALVVIHGPIKGRFVRENCGIAAANLTNYAHAKGLGTCYLGLLMVALDRSRKLATQLGVPKGRKACLALTLGRPDIKYQNTVIRPPASIAWVNEKPSPAGRDQP